MANLTTVLGPILSINLAVTVFTEFARAFFKVLVLPYLSPEFFGHHCSTFPNLFFSIQNWLSGNESHGDNFNWSIAAAYTNGLKVDPICLLPFFTISYWKCL